MGVEIKTMEYSVWNYLIEKINYNTKVHFLTFFPQSLPFVISGSRAALRVVLAVAPDSVRGLRSSP